MEMDDLSFELSANLLYNVSAGHKSCEKQQLFRPRRPDPLAEKRSASTELGRYANLKNEKQKAIGLYQT